MHPVRSYSVPSPRAARHGSHRVPGRIVAALGIALAATCAPVLAQDDPYPDDEVTFLVNYGAGGGVDRTARALQPFLPDALGAGTVVENIGGAGGKTGLMKFLEREADGYTVLTAFAPATTYTKHTNPELFSMDDLAVLNVQWTDPAILLARKDTGWTSLADMVEAVRADPGGYTFGSSGKGSVGPILARQLFGALDLDVKSVPYKGGGATRKAFAGGEVDMTAAGAGGATSIADDAVVLGAFWPDPIPEWPTATPINDALEPYGVEVADGGAYRFHAVHADVRRNHPERFDALVEALETATTSEAFVEAAEESGVGHDWFGPDESQALIERVDATFTDLLESE